MIVVGCIFVIIPISTHLTFRWLIKRATTRLLTDQIKPLKDIILRVEKVIAIHHKDSCRDFRLLRKKIMIVAKTLNVDLDDDWEDGLKKTSVYKPYEPFRL